MNRADLDRLVSERAQVMRMLGNIPLDRVIDRGGLEYRLDELKKQIEQAGEVPPPAKAVITFNGKPVVGESHGIYFDFATKALRSFANAVATLAVPDNVELGERARIPGKQQNSLVITGTALGSFGFELEEAPNGELGMESPTAQALDQITEILSSTRASDDELASTISDVHPRALRLVRTFMELLVKNEAVMTLSTRDKSISFSHVAEVERSLERMQAANVHEAEEVIRGHFLAVLPHLRTFEFVKEGEQDPIRGKVPKSLSEVDTINDHRRKIVDAKFKVTKVGEGKPSYLLIELPDWG